MLDDVFLTVDDVAELLKLNPQTVRNWIDRGDLAAVRVGPRRVRIRHSDLDTFIERSSNPGRPNEDAIDERAAVAWHDFGVSMAAATAKMRTKRRTGLVDALRAVADAARDLADALDADHQAAREGASDDRAAGGGSARG